MNLTQGTVWTMTGNSTATTVINDNSQIIYTTPTGDPTQLSSYKTLTARNYTGVNGTIGLNTFLGADGSPRTSSSSTAAARPAIRCCASPMRAAPAPGRWRMASQWCRRSTAARRRPAPSHSPARCAAAPSTMICSVVASTAAVPTIGSCARASSSDRRSAAGRAAGRACRPSAAGADAAGRLSDHRAGDRDLWRGPTDRPAIGDDDARHLA